MLMRSVISRSTRALARVGQAERFRGTRPRPRRRLDMDQCLRIVPARFLSSTSVCRAASGSGPIKVTFVEPDGEEYEVEAQIGDHMLDVAHDNDIELEGACGGELACSTCHVILDQEYFDKLDEPEEEEEDMLDLALGLTDTSRLGCQVCASPELNGMRMIIPEETADMR